MSEMKITSGGTYSIVSDYTGTIIINTTDAVTIDGTNAGALSNVNITVNSKTANLKIKDLNITNSSGSIIKFGTGKDNKLTLAGTNTLKTKDNYFSAINNGGGLTIDGEGILNVTAKDGAAIGSNAYNDDANLDIMSPLGDIIINGGTINAKAGYGAAIGSGAGNYSVKYNSSLNSVGDIIVNGGNVTATSSNGAGIGTGWYGGYVNDIVINGGTINAQGTYNGTGIGGADSRKAGSITINGGEITATGYYGAGIGGSLERDITIKDGTIIAKSGWGAGIGSDGPSHGSLDSSGGTIKGNIIISGGTVTAASGAGADIVANYNDGGAGIGGGRNGSVDGDIIINGTANVTAIAGRNATAIGSGYSSGGWVNYTTKTSGYDSMVGDIKIGGDATVTAISEFNCVGIGAGLTHDGGGGTKGSIDIGDTSPYGSGGVIQFNYNAGAITLEGDTSSSDKSRVTIVNSDDLKIITINGKKYSGESKFIFVDGQKTNEDFNSNIMAGGKYTLPENFIGTITINTTEAVTIDGTSAGKLKSVNIVVNSKTADLTIRNLNIANKVGNVIKFGSGIDNKLTLIGTNNLVTSADHEAGIHVGGGLTIDGEGALDVQAQGTYGGAGIGNDRTEESSADIKINGGTITASGIGGAGIGSGQYSSIGNIAISGSAKVTSSSKYGAGIGSGEGSSKGSVKNITIGGNTKINATSYSGAGIGSGYGGEAGNIKITDSAIVTSISTNGGAGIGSGESYNNGSAGNISINGSANVTATANKYGAGIGSGHAKYRSSYNCNKKMGTISIGGDAIVTANSLENGVGIGAGYADDGATNTVGEITLSGDSSTSTVSTVTINNSDTAREITINGKNYSGSQILLKDGLNVDDVLSGDYRKSETFTYNGGNVIITNYSGEDTVKLTSGKVDSYSFAGDDLVFKIGKGFLTLKNMKNHAITVTDSTGNTTTQIYGTDYSPQDVIKKIMDFLKDTTMNGFDPETGRTDETKTFDAAVRACSRFKDTQDLLDHFVADCRTANDSDKFLREYCGIILDNTDTGAITGWDAGGLKIKTAEDIMPETLPVANLSSYSGKTFTKRNLSIYLPERAEGYEELSDEKKRVLNGAYSWWVEESLKLIEESYGITFKEGDKINLYVLDDESQHPYGVKGFWGIVSGGSMYIDMSDTHFNGDSDLDAGGLDRVFAHEFTHVAYSNFSKGYLTEGLAELTHGIDDWRTSEIRKLADDADLLERHMLGKQSSYQYSAGYMLWRYLAKQASDIDAPAFGNITAKVQLNTTANSYYISGEKNSETASSSGNLKIGTAKNRNYVAENLVAQSIVGGNEGWSITATDIDDIIITGSGNDSINTRSGSDTVNSGAGNDVIDYFTGKYMSIAGGEGNDTIHTENRISYGSRTYSYNTLSGDAGNDSIEANGDYTTVLGGTGDDTIEYGDNFNYWDGGDGKDDLYFWGKNSTIHGGSGNDTIKNVYHGTADGSDEDANIIFYGDDGDDVITLVQKNHLKNITIDGGKGNDTLSGSNQGEVFQYVLGDGFDLIKGFDSNDTLSISGGSYSAKKSGSDIIVKVSNGSISLVGAASLDNVNILGNEIPDWKTNGTKATYGTLKNILIVIDGVKSTDGINVDTSKKTVTIKSDNLDAKSISFSSNSGGYSFALDGVNPSTPTDAHFVGNTFKSASKTAGYSLSSDKKSIFYTPAVEESDLFTLSNVKNTESISVDIVKKTVTLNANNLTGKNVSITGDYTMALSGVDAAKTTAAHFDGSTYKSESNTAGYALDSAKTTIKYTTAKDAIDLFTLSGIKSASGIVVDTSKKIVTLKAANLNAKNVTFSANTGGYTMALASDVDTTKENISKWTTLSSGNVAYLKDGTGSYYALNSKKTAVTYNSSVAGANQIEFSGVKGTPTLSGSTVKLTASNFNSNVGVKSNAGGYTLALSGDFKNKTLTGTANADKITSSGSNLVISGGKGNDTATLGSNNTFLYAKGDGNDVLYSFGNDDKIKLTGTTKATPSISGKDVIITTDGGKITVKDAAQGKVVKIVNDKDSVLSAYTYYADRIVNGKSVTLTSTFKGTFDAKNFTNVDGSAVTNAIKITGGTSASTLTGGSGADTIAGGKANDKLFGNAGNDSLSGGDGADTLSGTAGNDKLLGGAGNDSLSGGGGDGNDTLLGDAGNDNLTGGKGKDTFVFSGGKDTITDYTAGDDNVSVASSLGKGKFSVSGKNVIMTYGSNTLTITNGLDKKITFNGMTSTYKKSGIFNADSTAVTLPGATKTFDASAKTYSKVVTVDGSSVSSTIKITGNDKANVLTAGANGSTLSGGKGNDSLNGGAGNDSILGGADNDKLLGNAGNDILSGGDGNDTLSGGAGNDKLTGDKGNDSLVGGNGADTLTGGAGNDNLTGGKGKDTFVFSGGKDTITDYTVGDDNVSVASSLGKGKFSVSGKNVIMTYGSNTLTITNGLDKKITFNGMTSTYKKSGIFNADSTAVTLPGATKTFDASAKTYSKVVTVDGSSVSSTIKITGNDKANVLTAGANGSTLSGGKGNDSLNGGAGNDSILGGANNDKLFGNTGNDSLKGGDGADTLSGGSGNDKLYGDKGNDSLWGGAGNDTLYGGTGDDIFIYKPGEGTDTIFDYAAGDMLKILKKDGKEGGTFTKAKFASGDLTLTISGGGTIIFDNISKGDKFNINDKTYTLGASKLK